MPENDLPRSQATTVREYLAGLPVERRAVVSAVRELVRANLPAGYQECFAYGMIGYVVPLSVLPDTYNGQPLGYVALAAQKNYYALYLSGPYGDGKLRKRLQDGFKRAGKRLDMGKSCLRFKTLEDLPLDVVGEVIAAVRIEEFVKIYRESRGAT